MAKQGRCYGCGVRYEWQREILLEWAACPVCHCYLHRTTRDCGRPTVQAEWNGERLVAKEGSDDPHTS